MRDMPSPLSGRVVQIYAQNAGISIMGMENISMTAVGELFGGSRMENMAGVTSP